MSNIEKLDKGKAIDLLHGPDGLTVPKPFNRQIFLFETHVAGTSYIENMDKLAEKIEIGTRVSFYREASNEYDEKAIKVELNDGSKIGYIQRQITPYLQGLWMRESFCLARLKKKEKRETGII